MRPLRALLLGAAAGLTAFIGGAGQAAPIDQGGWSERKLSVALPNGIELAGSTALAPIRRGDWLWANVHDLAEPLDPASPFLREWHPGNQPTPVDAAFARAAMDEILAVPLPVWRGVVRDLTEVPAGRHAADIRAPTLILSGGKDSLFPAEHHRALAAAIPHARARIFPELGHNLIWERPDEVAPVLAEFLAGKPR